jgi:DNA-binding response OmpR family regulator
VSESPLILVIEDEYPLQAIVEEALSEAGFATDILSSAEEALALFKAGAKNYRALVTDVNLKGRLSGGTSLGRSGRETRPSPSST